MDGWMDAWTNGWMNGRMNGCMRAYKHMRSICIHQCIHIYIYISKKHICYTYSVLETIVIPCNFIMSKIQHYASFKAFIVLLPYVPSCGLLEPRQAYRMGGSSPQFVCDTVV